MRIAAAQMELSTEMERNAERIRSTLLEAAERDISLLCFPETALSGYSAEVFTNYRQERAEQLLEELHAAVLQSGVSAIVGTPFVQEGKLYNSAAVLLDDGRRLEYHKQNLVEFEQAFFTPGKETLVFEHKGLQCGVVICRDQNFPLLFMELVRNGAQLVFILSAHYFVPSEARWKLDKNNAFPIARATENKIYVCKANTVGSTPGKVSLGNSIVVAPNGAVVARAGETEQSLVSFDLDQTIREWSW